MAKRQQKKMEKKNRKGRSQKAIKKKSSKNCAVKRVYQVYSAEKVAEAISAINSGKSIREVSLAYDIPKSTLHEKLHNISKFETSSRGPPTVLSKEEENNIENWILECSDRGFPITKTQLIDCVQKYVLSDKRNTPFKDGRPGKNWIRGFMRRHSTLTNRMPQNLTCTRASVNEIQLRKWFSNIKEYMEKKNLLNLEPRCIFNLDESSFKLVPQGEKVIAKKGTRNVYQIVGGNEKACVTVLFIASADGKLPPPMILFECKMAPKRSTLQHVPKGWGVGHSENGWMTSESFFSYIKNVLFPWLVENQVPFPVVLFLDNHSSHLSMELLTFCKENMIEIIALYPNSTHVIQPLDVAFFHPLKELYKKAVLQYKIENNIVNFKKSMVATVLNEILKTNDFSKVIKKGFQSCGLYPLNPDAVDYNILKKGKKNRSDSSTDNTESITDSAKDDSSSSLNSKVLDYFNENLLSPNTLEAFKLADSNNEWTGDLSKKELFKTWQKMKRLCVDSEEVEENNFSQNTSVCIVNSTNLVSDVSQEHSQSLQDFDSSNLTDITENDRLGIRENFDSQSLAIENETSSSFVELDIVDELGQPITAEVIGNCEDVILELNQDVPIVGSSTDSALSITQQFHEVSLDTTNTHQVVGELPQSTEKPSYPTDEVLNLSVKDDNNGFNNFDNNTKNFEKVFKLPSPITKRKCNKSKIKKIEGNSAYNIDDMLSGLEVKQQEKILKEKQSALEKEKKEKARLLKEKESNLNKSLKKIKTELLSRKKDIMKELKDLKQKLKNEVDKENIENIKEQLTKLNEQLKDIEKNIHIHEMEVLAKKIKIKQEIM